MTYCTPTPIPDNLPVIDSSFINHNRIVSECLWYYGISEKMLKNKSKQTVVVRPRQVISYFLCNYTPLKLSKIAELVGYRNHTNVVNARKKVEDLIEKNNAFKAQHQSLKQYLRL